MVCFQVNEKITESSAETVACLFYKLVVEREIKGCNPDSEDTAHKLNYPAEKDNESFISYQSYRKAEKRREDDLLFALK